MPRANRAVEDDAQNEGLDEAQQQEQFRQGQVGEDDFIRSVAKRAGWTDQEEWKRDPAKWVDARTYLEKLPDELESLKERTRRNAAAAASAMEDAARRGREEALAEYERAVQDGNEQGKQAARQKLEQATPHPETIEWVKRNAWFNDDQDARDMAVREVNRLAQQGLSITAQLEGAEEKVRQRFPEYFGSARREVKEVRLSERPAPAVATGTRSAPSQPREKGFADMSPGDQALFRKNFEKRYTTMKVRGEDGQMRYMTPKEAQDRYARAYWASKEEQ